ncbi:N-formylglutamate amidohydrolase [Sphingobium algorifonticola]|uniref:N-formylglutamate amidohydrolase n=1 Tax=Sphingobium algorifonticola TaxID=2008318 RepID=A0A437JCH2_9SPHN|nr:N-formylglutamate amidohydrolase [Sphingobium algorifonticola]RVT43595.1 N-formylglutamate amidohydrolase [Sphingobium algorifonticola]
MGATDEQGNGVPALRAPLLRCPAFDLYGADGIDAPPASPVVVSVPHAGRAYPAPLLALSRVPAATLRRLEDRYADLLVHGLIARGHDVLLAHAPRALIDLNRDTREIDPVMLRSLPHGVPLLASAKLRGGLGLVPRRLPGVGDLWRGPIDWADVRQRIAAVHAPYHATLADRLARARAAFGYAILLDVHSMPPLPEIDAQPAARIVLGDRFGRSASHRLIARAHDMFALAGLHVAQNHPYPGNYLLERHGRPERDIHALQVEVDRSLYLDSALDRPGPGLATMQAMLVRLADILADEWPGTIAQAAE